MTTIARSQRDPFRWVVLAAGTLAQTSYAAVFFGVAVMAPQLRDYYHLSLTQVGVVIASIDLGSMLTLLAWGMIADVIGERRVIAAGLCASGVALAATAFTHDFYALIALLAFSGLAGASVSAASGRAVMHWFAPDQRGIALGIRQSAYPLGGVAASLVLPHLGVRTAFLALGAFSVLGAIAGLLVIERLAEHRGESSPTGAVSGPLHDMRLWRVSSGSALLSTAQACVVGFGVLFLHERHGMSVPAAGVVVAAMQVMGGVLRIAIGRWSDVLGTRLVPLRAMTLALSASVALVAMLDDGPRQLLIAALVISGSLAQGWSGLAFTSAAEIAGGARSGTALGLQQTGLALWGAAIPPLFAILVQVTSWAIGFAVVALTTLTAYPVLRGIREIRHGQTDPSSRLDMEPR
jgi:sugar phosphate permease